MRIRTIVRERISDKKKPKSRQAKFIIVILLISESVINTFIPFLSGFYLATTQRLFWLIPFIVLIVFNLKIEYKNELVEIKIMRNI